MDMMQPALRKAILLSFITLFLGSDIAFAQSPCPSPVPYGHNAKAGHYATVNGIRLYYEIYGTGPALLLLHGNDGSLDNMSCQIEYFAKSHKVVAVDGRGRGKSDDGNVRFTFELQADDFAALLDHEKIDKADILGHSDGGITALVMGMRHAGKVNRIVAVSPNLRPDALVDRLLDSMKQGLAQVNALIAANDKSDNWPRVKRQLEQDLEEPHIAPVQLKQIQAPVLLVRAEQDLIKHEHFTEMQANLTKGELFIVPGTIHQNTLVSPRFNQEVERFLK